MSHGTTLGCPRCGHLACVCDIVAAHDPDCPFRRSATCSVAIECEHGYDVCPRCDPCTCGGGHPDREERFCSHGITNCACGETYYVDLLEDYRPVVDVDTKGRL